MSAVPVRARIYHVSRRADALLAELGEACQQTLKLLAQLEMPGLNERQIDDLLGELSALIVHLHEHTRGLDKIIDNNPRTSRDSKG